MDGQPESSVLSPYSTPTNLTSVTATISSPTTITLLALSSNELASNSNSNSNNNNNNNNHTEGNTNEYHTIKQSCLSEHQHRQQQQQPNNSNSYNLLAASISDISNPSDSSKSTTIRRLTSSPIDSVNTSNGATTPLNATININSSTTTTTTTDTTTTAATATTTAPITTSSTTAINNTTTATIISSKSSQKNNNKNINRRKNSLKGIVGVTPFMPFLTPIVKRLVSLKRGNVEDRWNEKAVKGLARRLKKNAGSLEELEKSISEQNPLTNCVTIPRSLDGRLQVSQRKGLPHVIYCQLWRWPDLQSRHQIKGIESCSYSFNLKLKLVCINPYHYERVGTPPLPPVMVTRTDDEISPELTAAYESFTNSLDDNIDILPMDISSNQSMCSKVETPPDYISENGGVNESILSDNQNCLYPVRYVKAPDNVQPIPYTEPHFWSSIIYYELGHRVGEKFLTSQPCCIVDGFTDPSGNDRFCLGIISNINRDPISEQVRKHIGQGIKLSYVGGEVFVECLSSSSVFVQSANSNQSYGWDPASVCKVPPGYTLKIFNNQEFASLLSKSVNQGFDAVFALTKMCSIRLSFVKGWGAKYRRREILSTPCWIEIQLNGPLQWLDRVLRQMGSPLAPCSSMS